jgi:hypothetical protein
VTLRVNEWYRVKSSGQYCRIQRIPSVTDPRVSLPVADENTRGFELALEWYTPSEAAPARWSKRVIIMTAAKALGLLREPLQDDRSTLDKLREIAASLPISSASRDGEFTWRV